MLAFPKGLKYKGISNAQAVYKGIVRKLNFCRMGIYFLPFDVGFHVWSAKSYSA
jgi:hypothetical protein